MKAAAAQVGDTIYQGNTKLVVTHDQPRLARIVAKRNDGVSVIISYDDVITMQGWK